MTNPFEILGVPARMDLSRDELEARELRGSLQQHNDELSGMIQDTYDQLSNNLANETRELSDAKLAREDLAGLLTEVALRLRKDFKLPDA